MPAPWDGFVVILRGLGEVYHLAKLYFAIPTHVVLFDAVVGLCGFTLFVFFMTAYVHWRAFPCDCDDDTAVAEFRLLLSMPFLAGSLDAVAVLGFLRPFHVYRFSSPRPSG